MNYINADTLEYPVSQAAIKAANPMTLFAEPFEPVEPFAAVAPADVPSFDSATEKLLEALPELLDDGWQQVWEVVPLTQAEIDEARRVRIPAECSPSQGLVALYALRSISETDVQTAIAGIADPVDRYTASIAFNRATAWLRHSPTMQTMAGLLSLSEADLDELFEYAVGVQV